MAPDIPNLAALKGKAIGVTRAVTQLQGKSKILMRLDTVTPRWISQIQYASEDAIAKQADPIRRTLRGIFHALRFMRDQPDAAAGIAAKKLGWSPDAGLGAHRISGPLFPTDGTISVEALAAMQTTLLEHGVIKKRLPLEEHFTKEFTPVRL